MGDTNNEMLNKAGDALEGAAGTVAHAAGEAAAHADAHGHLPVMTPDGQLIAGGRHVDHPPEPPTMVQFLYYGTKPKEGTPEGQWTATQKVASTLYVGRGTEKMPFVNYQPWDAHVFLAIACAIVIFFAISLTRPFRSNRDQALRNPSRSQAFVEYIVETLDKFFGGILGPKWGRHYLPYVGSLFILILVSNLLGLFPLMKPPTASIVVTFSLALCTFCYVQWTAMTKMGPGAYFYHLAGEPKSGITWAMSWFIFLVELVGVFVKPLSLSLRLFGNMLGKDILLGAFMMMGLMAVSAVSHDLGQWFGLPFTVPFYFLGILSSVIQAAVFSILSAIYILLVLPHEHHHDEEHGDGHGHHEAHAH